jgi:hypothetical protein
MATEPSVIPTMAGLYAADWRRFRRQYAFRLRVLNMLSTMFFGLPLFKWELDIPLDYENCVLDRRPIKDGSGGADQGARNRAERMLGAKALLRDARHEKVDTVLQFAGLMRAFGTGEEEVFDFLAVEEADLHNVEVDPEMMALGEIVDLMSVELVEEHTCSAAPIGDLWGETLPWGSVNVVRTGTDDDGQPIVEVRYKNGKILSGTLKGGAEKYGRWSRHKGFTLDHVKDPRITRKTKGEVQAADRARAAVSEAIDLILKDEVPEFLGGRGRPRLVWVVFSTLGALNVPACRSWIGRYEPTDAILDALTERASEVAELLPTSSQ